MTYYRSLDSFRAMAVMLVILFHGHYLPCGWIGVQWFFVLSGFLITGILLEQKAYPIGDYLTHFFWRRTMRIWPLYFLYLCLFTILYAVTGRPAAWGKQWEWLVTFTYNFYKATPDYFSTAYFGHLWSLCVEEQFYLIWPLLVFGLSTTRMRVLAGILVVAGPAIRALETVVFNSFDSDPRYIGDAVYSFTSSHLDAFAAGACIALLPLASRTRWAPRAGWLAVGTLAFTLIVGLGSLSYLRPRRLAALSSLGYPVGLPYIGQSLWGYTVLNLAGAACIFALVTGHGEWLNRQPSIFIGKISFGIYVWHAPLQEFAERYMPASALSIIGLLRAFLHLAATLALATASYYGFERTFLKLKSRYPRPTGT